MTSDDGKIAADGRALEEMVTVSLGWKVASRILDEEIKAKEHFLKTKQIDSKTSHEHAAAQGALMALEEFREGVARMIGRYRSIELSSAKRKEREAVSLITGGR